MEKKVIKGVRNQLIREPTPIIHEAHIRKIQPNISQLNIAESITEECKPDSRQQTSSRMDEGLLSTRNEEIFMNPFALLDKSPEPTPAKTIERQELNATKDDILLNSNKNSIN